MASATLFLALGGQMGGSLLAMMCSEFQLSRKVIFDPASPIIYLAVAQVLAYIFQLKTARENHWDEPLPPGNINVPEAFKQGL